MLSSLLLTLCAVHPKFYFTPQSILLKACSALSSLLCNVHLHNCIALHACRTCTSLQGQVGLICSFDILTIAWSLLV